MPSRFFYVCLAPLALFFLMGMVTDTPPGVATTPVAVTTMPVTDSATAIIALLREFGFPIFVTVWFMWRLEKKLDAFTQQIEKLTTIITVMAKVDFEHKS